MRVLICGGRKYAKKSKLIRTLNELHAEYHFTFVITGGNGNADAYAWRWAMDLGLDRKMFRPLWEIHGQRLAGPMRNKQMLVEGKPELVIAFPGGTGTAHMCGIAEAAGVKVLKVDHEGR